jgi:transcription termination factor Rho
MSESTENVAEQPSDEKPKRARARKAPVATEAATEVAEEAPKPRRGRPRKVKPEEAASADGGAAVDSAAATEEAPKPRRGRPRKVKAEDAASAEGAAEKPASKPAKKADKPADEQRALTEDEAAALIAAGRAAAKAAAANGSEVDAADPTAMYPRRHREKPSDADSESEESGKRRRRRSVKAEGGASSFADGDASENNPSTDEGASGKSADVRPGRAPRGERGDQRSKQENAKQDAGDQRKGDNKKGQRPERGENGGSNANGGNDRNGKSNRNRNDRNNRRNNKNNRNREVEPSITREELAELKVADLRERAATLELDVTGMKKAELVEAVFDATMKAEGFREVSGILDILADGYGFLRTQGYLPSEGDCYVGLNLVKRNGLRKGDLVVGQTRPSRANEKYAAIQRIISVNGTPVEELGRRVRFADLTPVYPQERLWMEHGKSTITSRVIDLVAPIGKGQRGLIVSPPKAGKTTILKDIAASISANNPEVHLMCLLIDERPEEVTDMERSIKGEVVSSTFDMPADNHIACAEMVIERAKRLVENGQDVVILLDSITRLARAYNLAQPASGRVLSGGVDSTALYPPKKFLGAARNIENGGSLTILASALIDTGSKMDEVIFEEFKGTGNMELKLDRNLADRRIFPAIDAVASGTRKEELLIDPQLAPIIWAVRRILANMNNTERATDTLVKSIKQTENNQEFLLHMARKAQKGSKVDSLDI